MNVCVRLFQLGTQSKKQADESSELDGGVKSSARENEGGRWL